MNPSEIVGTLCSRTNGGGGLGTDFECSGGLVPALTTRPYADNEAQEKKLVVTHTLRGEGFDASEDGTGRGTPLVPVAYRVGGDGDVWESGKRIAALTTGTDPNSHVLAYGGANTKGPITKATACNAKGGTGRSDFDSETFIVQRAVRRLTPRECERLQGFPDDYTLITHRGKPAVDGPRYKAIGNSIAIPVLEWIGQGLLEVDAQ